MTFKISLSLNGTERIDALKHSVSTSILIDSLSVRSWSSFLIFKMLFIDIYLKCINTLQRNAEKDYTETYSV